MRSGVITQRQATLKGLSNRKNKSPGILGLGHPEQVHVAGQNRDVRVPLRTPVIVWVPIGQQYVYNKLEVGLPSDRFTE